MFKKYLFSAAAFVLTIVAVSGASPYSAWLTYEPEIPDCLKKDL